MATNAAAGRGSSQVDPNSPRTADDEINAIPVRHPARWIGSVIIALLVILAIKILVTTKEFDWHVVRVYFLSHVVLIGLLHTVELTAIAMTGGIILGTVIAVMRLSPSPILFGVASFYTWFFRGTPILVQLVFWFNLAFVFPHLTLGVPGIGVAWSASTNSVMSPFLAAIIGFTLNEAAYMSEIIRSGILGVDEGQVEAAKSYGLTRSQSLRYIVLPQAMRVVLPPLGNQVIGMLKGTSMASVIAFPELLESVTLIYQVNLLVIPLLIVASVWYLIVTSILYVVQGYIEKRYARGSSRNASALAGMSKWKAFLLTSMGRT